MPDFSSMIDFGYFSMGVSRQSGLAYFRFIDNEQPQVRVVAIPLEDALPKLELLVKAGRMLVPEDTQEGSDG